MNVTSLHPITFPLDSSANQIIKLTKKSIMTAMSKDDFEEGVRNRKGKGSTDQKSVKVPGPPRFEERFEEDVDKFGR